MSGGKCRVGNLGHKKSFHSFAAIMDMKERIQQKAGELFHRYGIKSITMDEIASQLGVSKKTIYQFFADKEELVMQVASEIIGHSRSSCDYCKQHADNAIHEVFNLMDFLMEMFSNINPVMLFDLEKFHPRSYAVFQQYKEEYLYEMISKNIRQGVAEGLYRENLNVDVITRIRLEGMVLGFNQQVFPAARYNIIDVQRILLEHFLFGIASAKGHKLILKYQKKSKKKLQHHESN